MEFIIYNNTDTIDIDQKCVGLSVSVFSDISRSLNDGRGLKIQIRHNRNPATYHAANQLANLVSQAPSMLSFIKQIVAEQKAHGEHGDQVIIQEGELIIRRAGG